MKSFSRSKVIWNRSTVIEKLPITTIHPGHGNSFTGIEERIREIRAHHALKKQVLLEILNAQPKTTYNICSEMIGAAAANWDDWEKFMALNETYVYLQELKRDGAIQGNYERMMSCFIPPAEDAIEREVHYPHKSVQHKSFIDGDA